MISPTLIKGSKSTYFSFSKSFKRFARKKKLSKTAKHLFVIHTYTYKSQVYIHQSADFFFLLEKNCIFKRYLTVQKWPIMPQESMNLQENSVIKNL